MNFLNIIYIIICAFFIICSNAMHGLLFSLVNYTQLNFEFFNRPHSPSNHKRPTAITDRITLVSLKVILFSSASFASSW